MAIFNIHQPVEYNVSLSDKEKKLLERTRDVNRSTTAANSAAVISTELDMGKSDIKSMLDDLKNRGYIGTKQDAPSTTRYTVTPKGRKKLP